MGVTFDDKDYGYIVIIDEGRQELSSYESMILNHASTALKLIAQKYISNMEIESRYRDGFVQDIVLNNIKSFQEVIKRGKIYGWDLSEKFYTTIIVDIDDFKIQYLNIRSKRTAKTSKNTMMRFSITRSSSSANILRAFCTPSLPTAPLSSSNTTNRMRNCAKDCCLLQYTEK